MPPPTPTAAFASEALRCWRQWNAAGLLALCDSAPAPAAELAWWRALAALMLEDASALDRLEEAHAAHAAAGDEAGAARVAHAALVLCLLDTGAMQQVEGWLARAAPAAHTGLTPATGDDPLDLWWLLGRLARVALDEPDTPAAAMAATWVQAQLRSAGGTLSPDERLIAAQVLVDYHFVTQRYAQFDFLANVVEAPPRFAEASALMRARWHYTAGYAHYQVGAHGPAQAAWQLALQVAEAGGLGSLQLLASLALARLMIDRHELAEAQQLVDAVRPQWGAGRTAQLVELKQMRARLQLLRGTPVQAASTLQDALELADAAGLSPSERASCHTDLAQVLVALGRHSEAEALLARLAREHGGRDGQVFACLHGLLCAHASADDAAGAAPLATALGLARQVRYTMFFRLLPAVAAALCARALRCGIERAFVEEVIRSRALPAPPDADERWPWALWVRLLGGFEWRLAGAAPPAGGKPAHKPLELLRLLACEPGLALGLAELAEALWPESAGDAARKTAEMTVQRLRRLLGDGSLVWVLEGRVGLDATRVASDVQQRRVLVQRLESMAMKGEAAAPAVVLPLSARVLDLGAGELLPGAAEAPWLLAERRRCRQDVVRAALAASALLAGQGAAPVERELLAAALRVEPLSESLASRLMQALDAAGQRGDALRVFEQLRAALAAHGAQPGAAVLAQWRALLEPA